MANDKSGEAGVGLNIISFDGGVFFWFEDPFLASSFKS